mgnify:CR=1 FL=1
MKLYVVCLHFADNNGGYYEEFYSVHDFIEKAQTMVKNIMEESNDAMTFVTIEETTMNLHDRTHLPRVKHKQSFLEWCGLG